MKKCCPLLFFVLLGFALHGQEQVTLEKGTVSFLSSRNVYVKFASTENISIGDTLFVSRDGQLIPALLVSNKSSTSTVCTPLLSEAMQVSDEVIARTERKREEKTDEPPPPPALPDEKITREQTAPVIVPEEDEATTPQQRIHGRISAASYSSLSDYQNVHRMRYALIFRGDHVKNSRFSVDSYVTFRHTAGEWAEVKENLGRALKVYALSVAYTIDSTSHLTLGRKINPRISSIGAMDGLQYEKTLGSFLVGAIAGTRPDPADYGFNPDLLQVGAYAGFASRNPANYQQTTFGVIEQRNSGNTDRRFVYLQHLSEPVKNLNLFGSMEVDLYENIHNEVKNKAQLTNLFVSLRYRLSRSLRFSVSYDNRNNIIYYESYKSYIDQLIEDETRQGLRFGVSYRPFKFMTWGANAGWRFQKSDINVSKNLNTYLNFSRIPVLNVRASLTANLLQTNYLDSQMFGIRLSRDIIRKKLDGELYYRMMNYRYRTSENTVHQNIAGASLSWRIYRNLALYVYYEGTFNDQGQAFQRFNTRIIQRF